MRDTEDNLLLVIAAAVYNRMSEDSRVRRSPGWLQATWSQLPTYCVCLEQLSLLRSAGDERVAAKIVLVTG